MTKRKLLSGNFTPKREAEIEMEEKKDDEEKNFEAEVLKKLGGSFAFVRGNKKFVEPATKAEG